MDCELELMYKEKTRLIEMANNFLISSFGDLKMLGVLCSVLIAWKPFSSLLLDGTHNTTAVLFYVFLGLSIAITLIGLVNLQKHSIIYFHLSEAKVLEEKIRVKLNYTANNNDNAFQSVASWHDWKKNNHQWLVNIFLTILIVTIVTIPTVILYHSCDKEIQSINNASQQCNNESSERNKCMNLRSAIASYPLIYLVLSTLQVCIFWCVYSCLFLKIKHYEPYRTN